MESSKKRAKKRAAIFVAVEEIMLETINILNMMYHTYENQLYKERIKYRLHALHYSLRGRIHDQIRHMSRLIDLNDEDCFNNLRMSRNVFGRLCYILENLGGLRETRNTRVSEQVAIFLSVLSHHKKNRIIKFDFIRSGWTISTTFSNVLNAVLKLHLMFLVDHEPIPEDSTCPRWKWFKGCLGALDGTYIEVRVQQSDKPRYRNRKGDIAVNVLAACDKNMKFTYVLAGWEGSAADSRVLRDAIHRPNGLKVPLGNYYLADCGYSNGEGFLTPYRGVRYHTKDWENGPTGPQDCQEFYNYKHASTRNVIERTFGLLKMRWGVLRSPSYYPIKLQNRMIMACCLLHNFIRTEMPEDPLELRVPQIVPTNGEGGYIEGVDTNLIWSAWRDNLATSMFNEI